MQQFEKILLLKVAQALHPNGIGQPPLPNVPLYFISLDSHLTNDVGKILEDKLSENKVCIYVSKCKLKPDITKEVILLEGGTESGTPMNGNVELAIDCHRWTYTIQEGDTLTEIAKALAFLVNTFPARAPSGGWQTATSQGPMITLPGAQSISVHYDTLGVSRNREKIAITILTNNPTQGEEVAQAILQANLKNMCLESGDMVNIAFKCSAKHEGLFKVKSNYRCELIYEMESI